MMNKVSINVGMNDLIIVYITEKLRLGYSIEVSLDEFQSFLLFFEKTLSKRVLNSKTKMDDVFERFFKIKNIYWETPRIIQKGDFILPTYQLSEIDTYSLDFSFLPFEYQRLVKQTIASFLEEQSKREVCVSDSISCESQIIGQNASAMLVSSVFSVDNSSFVNNPKLLEMYRNLSKRIAAMHTCDSSLKIYSSQEKILAYSNYLALIQEYEDLFSKKGDVFMIDTEENIFTINDDERGLSSKDNLTLVRSLESAKKNIGV